MSSIVLKKRLINGNEAVAWAALAAGVDYFAHYPGSPVNMVEPALKRLLKKYDIDITINDALNEHIAALASAGASYCGARSLVVMKHVGMNIAADPFNYIGYTGVKGGMVIVVGTDPGANSSTGEEDTHWYVPQINFPLFEPTSVEEVYHYVQEGFDISEKSQVPVLVFIPGRLCYNSDFIDVPLSFAKKQGDKDFYFQKNNEKYINVGQRAVKNHRLLLERIETLGQTTEYSKTFFNSNARFGLITRGLTFGHAFESIHRLGLSDQVNLMNLDMVFPLNKQKILDFCKGKEAVTVIEDQDGFLEHQIKMLCFNDLDCKLFGKEFFPKYGEIVYSQVDAYLASTFAVIPTEKSLPGVVEDLPERLGTFCEGCPHRGSFFAIEKSLKNRDGIIGGDIGCSSLPPFRADWLLCMNAGIGVSQGMSHILKNQTVISTGGESTFFHAGITSLQSAVINKINLLHIVFDNRVVGMTGRQSSPTTNDEVDYRRLLKSIGVTRIRCATATKPLQFSLILNEEMGKTGVRVIWVRTPCAQTPDKITDFKRMFLIPHIDYEKCGACTLCYTELGCPAIDVIETGKKHLKIDVSRCMRCGSCRNICPHGAIHGSFDGSMKKIAEKALNIIKAGQGG